MYHGFALMGKVDRSKKDRRDDLRIRGVENREGRDSITQNSCGILEGGSRGIRADIRPLQPLFGIHLARSCRQNLTHGQLNAERVVDESRFSASTENSIESIRSLDVFPICLERKCGWSVARIF